MPSAPESGDLAVALAELRVAVETAARKLPDCRAKTQVLRHIGLAMLALERGEHYDPGLATSLCARCGRRFSFDEQWFRNRSLPSPRRCERCRKDRREEQEALERAGVP
jgi:hypothetical protein